MIWTLLLVGCGSGFLAGLFGIGGGTLIVSVLALLLPSAGVTPDRVMHIALATSLAAIVFTSISSLLAHHRRGAVLWPIVRRLAPSLVVGAIAGGAVARYVPSDVLRVFFGIFLLLVSVRLAVGYRPPASRTLPGGAGLAAAGGLIGVLSAWTGIGGGALSGPFLMWCNVPPRNAVACAAASGLPIAVAATTGFIVGGWGEPGLPPNTIGYVLWPAALAIAATAIFFAPLGARLAHTLPTKRLKQAFALLLFVVAIRLLMGD